jgi:hypothetical protein
VSDVVKQNLSSFHDANGLEVMPDFYELVPHPLRRMVFNYVPLGVQRGAPGPLKITPYPLTFPMWKRPWDLHLTMLDGEQAARLTWTGNKNLFKRETVEALLERYLEILGALKVKS